MSAVPVPAVFVSPADAGGIFTRCTTLGRGVDLVVSSFRLAQGQWRGPDVLPSPSGKYEDFKSETAS